MKRIFIPTQKPSDWQRLLAKPKMHWKKGYSAMTTAACWEAAGDDLPVNIRKTLEEPKDSTLLRLKMLAAMPEWEVELAGGLRSSQTDVMVLASNTDGLVVICVEAKVDEPFGPTLGDKRNDDNSVGQNQRIKYLHSVLGLTNQLSDDIRYQLLHRTVSAINTAQDFHASAAVMLVHSFSPTGKWRDDFDNFCTAMNATPVTPDLFIVSNFTRPLLYLAWCAGDKQFCSVNIPSVF